MRRIAVDSAAEGLLADLHGLRVATIWRSFVGQSASFKLACLYLILEYVRPQSVWSQLDFLPWTQITILLGLFSVLAGVGRRGAIASPTNAQLVVYALVVTCSIIVAYRPAYSLAHLDVFFPWVLIYFFLVNAVVGRTSFFLFIGLFLLCSFKMSQHGFLSWAAGGFSYSGWGVTGAPGFFRNSGEVGIQMCVLLPLATMFLLAVWKWVGIIWRAVVLAIPLTAVGTILAANSRGAVLGAIAAMAWLVMVGRSKFVAAAGMALVAMIGWFVAPPEFFARFGSMGQDNTSLTRLTYWRDGLDMIRHHPILGVGYENWIPYYVDHYKGLEGYYSTAQLCHNILIQATSELGIAGLAAFLAMVLTTFVLNARSRRLAHQVGDVFLGSMGHGLDAAMIGFLVSGQFVTVLYYPYFWVAMSLTVMLYTAARETAGVPFTARMASRQRPLARA